MASKGAIVECANFVGNTPLHYAAFWRHGEIVVYLASTCDATVNVKNSFKRYPSDATNPSLKIYLEGVAEQQDRKDLIGVELVERTKLLDLHNVDWVIEPQDISIEQMMAETLHSKVYLATCRKAIVAVKVPKFNRALIAEEIKTITKEFHFLKTVVHHSLNAYFGVCTDKEFNICYMSPYQDGGTLEEVLFDASVEISQQEVLNYSLQICMAMQFLHSFNPPVCHGRLKPSNVLVNKAGKILISDFGFKDSVFNSGVFDPYHIYDPMWMAPELLMGQKYSDARAADVYSTALVLFSLITRAIPFNIQNPMVLGFQIAVNKLTPEMPAYIPANLVTHAN